VLSEDKMNIKGRILRLGLVAGFGLGLFSLAMTAQAAERISVTTGAFLRSIEIAEIESWVETGDPGSLASLFRLAKIDQEELRKQLSATIDLDVVAADKVLNSDLGYEILLQVGAAVKPYRNAPPEIAAKAIRSAFVLSCADGPTSVLKVLRTFPTDQVIVDLTRIGDIEL
jgi:Alpha/beta hydrolase of unknown function (DUF1400)